MRPTLPLLLLAPLAGGLLATSSRSSEASAAPLPATKMEAAALYLRHCAPCHGDSGRGDGPGAGPLEPKPRDFGAFRFRLVSTANGIPTREDLIDVIRRGIVGSAMPPHDRLNAEQHGMLADHVLQLALH